MSSSDDRFSTQVAPLTALPETHQRVATEDQSRGGARLAWELFQTIVLTVVIFLGVRAVVQNFRVEGASMEPTLHTGQYLLINKVAYFRPTGTPLDSLLPITRQGSVDYLFGGPQRGDVAVFRAPNQPDKDFIKRVIGLPGDLVLVRGGQVFVSGQRLDEPYIQFPATYTYPADGRPLRVPEDSYFVLGDNRPNSSDSRLGWFVPVDNLVGRAWLSYWPPASWGVLTPAVYAQ